MTTLAPAPVRTAEPAPARAPRVGRLFVPTVLLGSFLLFLVQPMVARMALPRLGGAPAVWNSAMVVYQVLLLGGYAYAHLLGRLPVRRQAVVHLAVLALAALWLPLGLLGATPSATSNPVLWVPGLLSASIGPLFFAVAAQAPLLQRWYAAASGGRDPYALYAASNLGSLGGLLAFPLLVEPRLATSAQSWLWTGGYAALLLLVGGCTLVLRRVVAAAPVAPAVSAASGPATRSAAPGRRRTAYWVVCGAVPSALMLATTTYLTTDVGAMPLLWVLPLGLYLVSFTIAFASRRGPARALTRVAPVVLVLLGGAVLLPGLRPLAGIGAALVLLLVVSVAVHTALYDARPDPDRLTGFYLAMSVGGALGGAFGGLVAPVLFRGPWEYPLSLLASAALLPVGVVLRRYPALWRSTTPRGRTVRAVLVVLLAVGGAVVGLAGVGGGPLVGVGFGLLVLAGIAAAASRGPLLVVVASLLALGGGWASAAAVVSGNAPVRSYFGVYGTVDASTSAGDYRMLLHGTTVHGVELLGSASRARTPTSYYVPESGVGQAMLALPRLHDDARVGVVGLGVGTLSCYAQPDQRWTFYEIDPVVRDIAEGPDFSFLRDCAAPDTRVVLGDARLSLATQPDADLDVLVLDAFSSDSVPMHLLTEQAFAGYDRVLADDGLLLVHVSNRFLDLEPVVARAARDGGWTARVLGFSPTPAQEVEEMATGSQWLLLAHDPALADAVTTGHPGWRPARERPGLRAWTDDYSSILPLLRRS